MIFQFQNYQLPMRQERLVVIIVSLKSFLIFPFLGNLSVTFTPNQTGTSFLNETGGTTGTNKNAGLDRTETLVFVKVGSNYTTPLTIATVDDLNSPTGGIINVTLKLNTTTPGKYTVSSDSDENTAQVTVLGVASLPLLSITDTSIVEGGGTSFNFVSLQVSSTASAPGSIRFRYQASAVTGNFLTQSHMTERQATRPFSRTDLTQPFTTNLDVYFQDDNNAENTGTFKVTLLPESGGAQTYRVGTDGSQEATVIVYDDDAPELTIKSDGDVTEGVSSHVSFTVSLHPGTSIDGTYVLYYNMVESSTGNGDFIAANNGDKQEPIDFRNKTKVQLSFAVENDSDIEANSTVTVTLRNHPQGFSHAKYTVATSPGNSATANIIDDDSLPLLTITAPTTPTAESAGSIDFVISATTNLGQDFRVRYDPSEVPGSNFLDETTTPTSQEAENEQEIDFSGSANNYTATLSVPIHNDNVGERTGQIKVELLQDDAAVRTYQVAINGSQTVRATIWDDDAPELKISAGNPVTEGSGEKATFTITSQVPIPNVNNTLTVNYTPLSADFIESGSGTPTSDPLVFSGNGPYTAPLEIDVFEDATKSQDGSIMVTLNEETIPASTYTVATQLSDKRASVSVTDYESLPLLSIAAPSTPVAENIVGGMVDFVITATTADTTNPGLDFRVRYDPSEVNGDNFLDENASPTSQEAENDQEIDFTGSGNTYTATLSVPIHNDGIGERTGQIEVTLLPDDANSQTYRVASDGSQTKKATIWDNDAPELIIKANEFATESAGGTVDFTIEARVSPNKTMQVKYNVAESTGGTGDFIASGEEGDKTPYLNFNGVTSVQRSVSFFNDEDEEDSTTLTITLQEETGGFVNYTVSSVTEESRAIVTLLDDDSLPLLTIAPPSSPVAESDGMVEFTISATSDLGSNYQVRYDPSEVGGNFLNDNANPKSQEAENTKGIDFTGSASPYTATLQVPIHDDDDGERTGQIQVTLLPITGTLNDYRTAADGTQTVMATILDDDAPELKIEGVGPVTEGSGLKANFTVTSQVPVPNNSLTVYYSPVSTDFLASGATGVETFKQIDFSSSSPYIATLGIDVHEDATKQNDGTIMVTLKEESTPATTYTVLTANNSDSVAVTDFESLPGNYHYRADNLDRGE